MRQHKRQQLAALIKRTHHGKAGKRTLLALGPRDPSQHFTPQRHGLSQQQCHLANQLLRRAERERPLHGTPEQQRFKFALRCGGIISAVKRNRVGNTKFGHHLQGYRGGNVMKAHGMHILREIGPIGSLTASVNREKRQAQEVWERTGDVLAPGATPPRTLEEAHIRHLTELWEQQQWLSQQNRFSW